MKNVNGLSREEVKEIIIKKLKPLGVERIALFGSFVRQDGDHFNDIDILVTFPKMGKRKMIGMRWFILDQELEQALGIPVDLVSEGSLNQNLRPIIQRDLEIIYEKTG